MSKIFNIANENEMIELAADFAAQLQSGDVVFLNGTLGAGKTVFARSIIQALANNPDLNVPSPTFTLLQTYHSDKGEIYHYDFYRLKSSDEVYDLEWDEALQDGIILIEWGERIKDIPIGKEIKSLLIEIESDGGRQVTLQD